MGLILGKFNRIIRSISDIVDNMCVGPCQDYTNIFSSILVRQKH